MRRSLGNRLTEDGENLVGPFMASQKDKRSAWAGFISNGQCFALTSRAGQCWLVESEEAAFKAAFDGYGWQKLASFVSIKIGTSWSCIYEKIGHGQLSISKKIGTGQRRIKELAKIVSRYVHSRI
jgi:hypothetical protein